MRIHHLSVTTAILCLCITAGLKASAADKALAFSQIGPGEFTFDTGVLRGKLAGGGKAKGFSSVVYLPTGTRLDASMGLCSHYRVFTKGKRCGVGAWDWPATHKLMRDGSVESTWPAEGERQFELRAVYRCVEPDTLEVETSVTAKTDLAGFESFVANYFSSVFTNALVCAGPGNGAQSFVPLEQARGAWQAFPRDEASVRIITDGRWKLEPNPVDWTIMPKLSKPIAIRRAEAAGIAGVLMASPGECFAVCSPHQTEGHYSTYISLFGRDLKAGETARAKVRLWVTRSSAVESAAIQRFSNWAQ